MYQYYRKKTFDIDVSSAGNTKIYLNFFIKSTIHVLIIRTYNEDINYEEYESTLNTDFYERGDRGKTPLGNSKSGV